MKDAERRMSPSVTLAVFAHSSNVIGSINPIGELIEISHKNGIPVLIDASQTAGCVPIDVEKLGVDYLAFTGHKGLMGPTGTGGLYILDGCVLDTLKEGGTGSMAVSAFQPEDAPDRYEAGTINMAGLAGLKASLDFIDETGIDEIYRHKQSLISKLINGLKSDNRIIMYGPPEGVERSGLLSINIDGVSPYDAATFLDRRYGIMTRAGLHCAPQAHRVLGTLETGTLRISVGWFNTEQQIDTLVSALKETAKELICC
jgi:selenocysteine lyase/cysteine desulfurase